MQFKDDLKKKLTDHFDEAGITLEDDEVQAALTAAVAQFNSAQKTGPASNISLSPAVYVAVDLLKPIMAIVFAEEEPPDPA